MAWVQELCARSLGGHPHLVSMISQFQGKISQLNLALIIWVYFQSTSGCHEQCPGVFHRSRDFKQLSDMVARLDVGKRLTALIAVHY